MIKFLDEINHDLSLAKKYALVGGGASDNWDPSDKWTSSTLKLWLESATTDWKTGGAQEYATFNGADISRIDDRSGNSDYVEQTTASEQPTTELNANGDRMMSFDHTANMDLLQNGTLGLTGSDMVIAFFGKSAPTVGFSRFFASLDAGSRVSMYTQDTNIWANAGLVDELGSGVWDESSEYIIVAEFDGATSSYSLNGDTPFTGNPGSQTMTKLRVGNLETGTQGLNGFIGDIVVLDSLITDDDFALLEGWLAWKNGAEALLPVGHAYKNAAPTA